MFTEAYKEYLKEQKENAGLRNRIKFIKKYKDRLTFKQKVKYLIRRSPSTHQIIQGGLIMAGIKKILNIHSPSQMLNDTVRKAMEDAWKELGW